MTCIVGLVHEEKVYIGGDSAGVSRSSDSISIHTRADEKVFKNGPALFGFTSSFRMGQLLRYNLTVPDHDPRMDLNKYMVKVFIKEVRDCLREGGYATKEKEQETGGTFLVGLEGKLFTIYSDYQVARVLDGYAAVGCGGDIALGVLYVTVELPPRERVLKALEAAEHHSAGVRRPFVVEVLE